MRRAYLLLVFFLFALNGYSQQRAFIEYPTNSGLVQSQVRAIHQDHQGYLWFATLGGLSRFDGFEFENFSTDDGLKSNRINCFHRSKNNFWIGTSGGFSRYNNGSFETVNLPKNFEESEVFDITESPDGSVWLALSGQGLLQYDFESFKFYGVSSGLPNLYIRAIKFSPDGDLHVGTRKGLAIKKGDRFEQRLPAPFDSVSVSDIDFTRAGEMIICSYGNGIIFEKEGKLRNYYFNNGINTNHVRCAIQLKNGSIWFGSKKGLIQYQDERFSIIDEQNGLPYENIKSLGTDYEGNLWVGTDGKGAMMQAGEAFISYSLKDGLNSELTLSICSMDTGGLAFGSYDNGISLYNGSEFYPYPYNSLLPNKTVWSLVSDDEGGLWAGTTLGLFYEKNGSTIIFDKSKGLPGNSVNSILLDGEILWVGTSDGLARMDIKNKNIEIVNSTIKSIRTLIKDGSGIILGSANRVYHYNKTLELIHEFENGNEVYCITKDGGGKLWVGTSDGLFTESAQGLVEKELSSAISAKNINFLYPLKGSTILAGTNDGLYRIHNSSPQISEFHPSTHYTNYEGLVSTETNQNAVFATKDEVWFGSTSGPIKYYPYKNSTDVHSAPQVILKSVELFLQETDWSNKADSFSADNGLPENPVLNSNENYLTFNYSGILLSNPPKLRYRYKLLGADEDWLGPTKSRTATYAYLPHGSYTFVIQAFSTDRPGLTTELNWSFTILPPFYLTPWFFILCALAFSAFVYFVYRARIKKEQQKQASVRLQFQSRLMELESQSLNSSMNRHFIFNALNSIQYYINVQDRKSANRYLTSFAKLIRMNLDSSQENETSLANEIERLELYLSLEQMRFQDRFDYKIHIESDVHTEDLSIPSMMLQPFLENSIWHGILPANRMGRIMLEISRNKDEVIIEIRDNGIGYQTSLDSKKQALSEHNSQGMSITMNRISLYQKMTGQNYKVTGPEEIRGDSNEVLGTRVEIRIPSIIEEHTSKKKEPYLQVG